jgi:hypothetical protein
MPTTNWRVARRDIARPFGLVEFDTSTFLTTDDKIISATSATGTTPLADRYTVDDYFNGQWFVTIVLDADTAATVTTGAVPANGAGTLTRRVEDYASATGQLTVAGANLLSEDEHVTCDLYNTFHPDDYKRAYNRARQAVFPRLAAHKDHKGIITDGDTLKYTVPSTIRQIDRVSLGQAVLASHGQNLLTDGGFEDWSSATALTNWTLTETGGSTSTVNQETSTTGPTNHMVLTGNYSARLYVPDRVTTLLETLTPSVGTQMAEVSMSAYVYCRVASSITLSLDGNHNTSNYHGGTGWELLQYNTTLDINDSSFTAGFYVIGTSVASTSYIDRAVVWAGPLSAPESMWDVVNGWEWIPPLDGASDGRPRDHEVLRLNGRNLLSSVSADTDTIELDGELLDPLYMKCRQFLCEEKAAEDAESDWGRRARDFETEYEFWFRGEAYHGSRPGLVVSRRGPF